MTEHITGIPQMLPTQVIDTSTDSREILAHARLAARKRKLHDWFIVDVDAHHVETVSWKEIVQYIEAVGPAESDRGDGAGYQRRRQRRTLLQAGHDNGDEG